MGGSVALAFLTLSVAAPQANAGAIYDNLAQSATSVWGISSYGTLADSFSTGASAVTVTDVQLYLGAASPADGATFLISLFPDEGTTPIGGAPLAVITGLDSSLSAVTLVDYVFTTPAALAANTRYWVVLAAGAGNTSVGWQKADTNGGTGTTSEYNYFASTVFGNSSLAPFQMQVNVSSSSATPEPASGSLMIVFGVCASVFLARRRKRVSVD
jgi:hypothetical protein